MHPLKRTLQNLLTCEPVLRHALLRDSVRRWTRLEDVYAFGRPAYRTCLVEGARLAVRLGYREMTAIEFGVATGNGLVALERIAAEVEAKLPIHIHLHGFDLGSGMPAPQDHRDLPWNWSEGYFAMDEEAVRSRLSRANLVIGDVRETVPAFLADHEEELMQRPIAALLVDVDYYSSTVSALSIFDGQHGTRLPRVPVYFDDLAKTNPFIGQQLAINEYNDCSDTRKIALRYDRIGHPILRQVLDLHDFEHPLYSSNVRGRDRQLAVEVPR